MRGWVLVGCWLGVGWALGGGAVWLRFRGLRGSLAGVWRGAGGGPAGGFGRALRGSAGGFGVSRAFGRLGVWALGRFGRGAHRHRGAGGVLSAGRRASVPPARGGGFASPAVLGALLPPCVPSRPLRAVASGVPRPPSRVLSLRARVGWLGALYARPVPPPRMIVGL